MKTRLSILLAILFCTSTFAQSLSKTADSLRMKAGIPEIAFAVIKADTILEMGALGSHKLGGPINANIIKDHFHIGSNTKAMTGVVAAKLVEEGKIKWSTKVFDLFPEWKEGSDTAYANITLQDLLSHRARIQPFTEGEEFLKVPKSEGSKVDKRRAFCRYLLTLKPVKRNKKEGYTYSNAGFALGAVMLEKASGQSWEELMTNTYTNTLGINVKFGWPNLTDTNQPWGHWVVEKKLVALPPDAEYKLNLIEPAGDVNVSLPDYTKFVQMNLKGLEGKDNYLKASSYQFLHFGIKNYAIGWTNIEKDGKFYSDHAGSAGTFYIYTVLNSYKDIAYVIVMNTATPDAENALFTLLKKMVNKYGKI